MSDLTPTTENENKPSKRGRLIGSTFSWKDGEGVNYSCPHCNRAANFHTSQYVPGLIRCWRCGGSIEVGFHEAPPPRDYYVPRRDL